MGELKIETIKCLLLGEHINCCPEGFESLPRDREEKSLKQKEKLVKRELLVCLKW